MEHSDQYNFSCFCNFHPRHASTTSLSKNGNIVAFRSHFRACTDYWL